MTFGQRLSDASKCLEDVGRPRLSPSSMKGKCRTAPVPKGGASGPASAWASNRGKTNIGCIFRASRMVKGTVLLPLQRLRPSGMLPRGGLAGHLLYHRRARDDRRHAGPDRRVEKAGVYKWRNSIPTPFMEALNKWAFPGGKASAPSRWTEEMKPDFDIQPAYTLLRGGRRLLKRTLRFTGRVRAHRRKILLAQKAFSMFYFLPADKSVFKRNRIERGFTSWAGWARSISAGKTTSSLPRTGRRTSGKFCALRPYRFFNTLSVGEIP